MLPKAILEAFPSDTYQKLGGIMELAKVDLDFFPKSIKDHPWIGGKIKFKFPEIGKGKIINCLIHPSGKLMFDVFFHEPVPPIYGGKVVLKDNIQYHQQYHRFLGYELKELVK